MNLHPGSHRTGSTSKHNRLFQTPILQDEIPLKAKPLKWSYVVQPKQHLTCIQPNLGMELFVEETNSCRPANDQLWATSSSLINCFIAFRDQCQQPPMIRACNSYAAQLLVASWVKPSKRSAATTCSLTSPVEGLKRTTRLTSMAENCSQAVPYL